MALSGQLLADFSDFTRACGDAVVSLQGFETGAGKVKASLDAMVDQFSGRQVIQDATLMAEAVERIGGASKLTEAELQEVGRTAADAAAKLTAMGQAVPPQIAALAKDFKDVDDSAKGAESSFTTLVGSFVTAEAITRGLEKAFDAVVDLVKEMGQIALEGAAVADVEANFRGLTEQAGRLGDTLLGALRSGTHNTISDFELMKIANQELATGVKLTDGEFATLAQGAFALAQATGGSVKEGLDLMNNAMITGRTRSIELRLGKVDLKGAEDAYAASLGVTKEELTTQETLYAAQRAILGTVADATARLGEQTDGLDEHVAQVQTSWANFRESLGKTVAESQVLEAGFTTLQRALIEAFGGSQQALIDGIALAIDKAAIIVVDFALGAVEGARGFHTAWALVETVVLGVETALVGMAAAGTEAYAVIAKGATYLPGATDGTKRMADEARAAADEMWTLAKGMAAETEEAAKGVAGTSAFDQTLDKLGGALFQTRDAMIAAEHSTTAHTDATARDTAANDQNAESHARIGKALEEELRKIEGGAKGAHTNLGNLYEMLGTGSQVSHEFFANMGKGYDEINKAQEAYHDAEMRATMSAEDYKIAKIWETVKKKEAAFAEMVHGDQAMIDQFKDWLESEASMAADAVSATMKASTDQMITYVGHSVEEINKLTDAAQAAQRMVGGIKLPGTKTETLGGENYLVGPNGTRVPMGPHGELPDNWYQLLSGQTNFADTISSLPRIVPMRAAGGPVVTGQTYLVGEQGPELFVPSSSGGILPHGSGGVQTTINITQPLGTPAAIAAAVQSAMDHALRTSGVRLPSWA